jgi:hypothetical protein
MIVIKWDLDILRQSFLKAFTYMMCFLLNCGKFEGMQKSIVWKGLQYDTKEHCSINFRDTTIIVRGEIEGWAMLKALYVEYMLILNPDWTIREIEIHFTLGEEAHTYNFIRHTSGHWTDASGTLFRQFGECRFVDISLTPLTNSLVFKSVEFTRSQAEQFNVLYFDVLANEVRVDVQRYTQIDDTKFNFENDGGKFAVDIDVDHEKFVTQYPNYFNMLTTS